MGGAGNLVLKYAGAGIITLPMSEVASALQTGVAEGIHTGLSGIITMKLWDIAPYFTHINAGAVNCYVIMNERIYQEFPPEIKKAIDAAVREWEAWDRTYYNDYRRELQPTAEKSGLKWYSTTPEETLRWRELFNKATVEWVMERRPENGKRLFGIVERITGRKVLP